MDTPVDLNRWFEASRRRKSVRDFAGPPGEGQLRRLSMLASALNGDGVRIKLLEATPALFSGLAARRLRSAKCAAALIVRNGTPPTRAGFKGETFVLECTAMDLGTCWLAGTFHRKEAKRLCEMEDGESLTALIAVGTVSEPLPTIPDSERKRKELDKLVVTLKGSSLGDMDAWQNAALKCARIAPSAVNFQPWRFAFAPGHICMTSSGLFGEGAQLDLGIAMLHIELGAASQGVYGAWAKENFDDGRKKPKREQPGMVWVFSAS